ncbi:MAG TPA: DUF255 domain-containing protein [Bacteroidales bacterium]|nr:DUF255 domain-containing protein [Bacteroidales bacterium]HOH84380.1 DUF255 domain-containing protein [Bacteroidales bacterium]
MQKKIFGSLLIIFLGLKALGQTTGAENLGLVNWIDIKTAQELNKTNPKPILIDVYTDWCGWCKHMMKTTFSDQGLANYINTYFYPVRFNAETKDTVEFQEKKYANKNTGNRSPNDLAVILLEGKMSYPTLVFYNNNYKFKMLAPGYLKVKDIEPILVFTVEHIFNTTAVKDFQQYYYKAFYPDSGFVNKDTVRWIKSFNDLKLADTSQKKKTLVFLNAAWCNGGRVMLRSTFNNSIVTKYINDHYNAVLLDPETSDTIKYQNQVFVKTLENTGLHPFLHYILGERIVMPSVLFFDEDLKFVSHAGQYLTPEALYPVLVYIFENHYKNKTWDEFIKTFIIPVK